MAWTTRNVNKDELDTLRLLANNDEYFSSDNIWCEQSKICVDSKGVILGFALIKEHSLFDYLNDKIQKGIMESEYAIINFVNPHYEVLLFRKDNVITNDNYKIYLDLINGIEVDDDGNPIGILWTPEFIANNWRFVNYNNVVWLDIPYIE